MHAAAPRANAGGISGQGYAPAVVVGRQRHAAGAIVRFQSSEVELVIIMAGNDGEGKRSGERQMEKHMMERDTVIDGSELLKRVKEAVLELAPEAEVILYGSRARGTARRDSDWDFLILLPGPVSKELEMAIKDRLYDIELETDTVLTSIIRSKQEWLSKRYEVVPLRREVEKDGIAV